MSIWTCSATPDGGGSRSRAAHCALPGVSARLQREIEPARECQDFWILRGVSDWLLDAGAETQANYHYQHCCAARWCIRLLRALDGVSQVQCETHEDFTVVFIDGSKEIVSVRYRDGGRGSWTVPRLVGDGVLQKLFQKWLRMDERPRCRLVTNGALDPTAKRFRDCCNGGDDDARMGWAIRLREAMSAGSEQVERFLRVLTVESRQVVRENVEVVEAQHLAPELKILNLAEVNDPRYFRSIVGVVAAASRAVDPVDSSATDVSRAARDRRRDTARTIDRAKVIGALLDVTQGGEPLLNQPEAIERPATMLVRKLEAGGIPPTTIEGAQLLRASWTDHESRWRAEVPGGDAEWSDLRTRVVHSVASAERTVDRSGAYGVAMLRAVEESLTLGALGRMPAMQLSDLLLLGLAYELTDECLIYWSPKAAVHR